MHIKEILSQHRRDFTAIYECEHCGIEYKGSGYDDSHFHQYVVPLFNCPECGKNSDKTYRALSTEYPDGYQI